MKKRGLIILFVSAILLTVAVTFGRRAYVYRYDKAILKDVTIKVYPETKFETLIETLEKDAVITNASTMLAFANDYDKVGAQVGNYKLQKGSTYRQVFNQLYYGNQTPIRVTFNNIRTLDRLAGRLSKYTLADSTAFLNTFRNKNFVDSLGFNYQTVAGMFLPNTYEVYWTTTPKELMLRMKKEYNKFWTKQRIEKAEKLGLSKNDVSVIASIVIEETKLKNEMTTVAGVYINRIKEKMPLQADPTVKFALNNFEIKRILNTHLEVKSPYNTYKNQGLPPGPIAIPDSYVLDAVLNYKGHKYLYFCAKADFSGAHAFATNLNEHNRNAAAYHNELNRRKIK